MFLVGVISDTHGFFDPRIPELFDGVDHILHAGDVGSGTILRQLEAIAPVTAVLGNTDGPLAGIRETELVELEGLGFLVHHIVDPEAPNETVRRNLAQATPDVVVFGHTHQPCSRRINGTLFFNPGYAGRSRFAQRRSVALLKLDGATIRDEMHWL